MKNIYFFCFIFSVLIGKAQNFKDSNLPIVIINTEINPKTGNPTSIPDNPRIYATMKVIYRPDGSRNYVTDQNNVDYLSYTGKISIESRGSSSQYNPFGPTIKRPYGLTTLLEDNSNNNVSILGLPKENDWILNSLAFDASYIRDYLSYELSRNTGNYASRGQFCEVVINGTYQGIYIFQEKLKIDSDRINIEKLTSNDNALPSVTGGYITKCDKASRSEPVAWTVPTVPGPPKYLHEAPNPSEIMPPQDQYIHDQFIALDESTNQNNESITTGYPSVIDVPSFIDFILLNEIASNVDAYQYSTYFHKERNGKLRAGPIWDFNLTYGNDVFGFHNGTEEWQFDNGVKDGSPFWRKLHENSTFKCYMAKRWTELRATNQAFDYLRIEKRIDEITLLLSEAITRDKLLLNHKTDHRKLHSDNLKKWLQERLVWLDKQLAVSSECNFPDQPKLVISKINYHPEKTDQLADDDIEFIEITNNSDTEVDLTGFHFRELGFTYSFPNNAIIDPNGKLIIAGNAKAFKSYYGFAPFGEFRRDLSNKSEKLILVDAFGNIVDTVEYFDSAPWPEQADGDGYFLEIINLKLDNNLASSWRATKQKMITGSEDSILIYPNPATTSFTIPNQNLTIDSYKLYDFSGRLVIFGNNTQSVEIPVNIEKLSPATYIVHVYFKSGNTTHKKLTIK